MNDVRTRSSWRRPRIETRPALLLLALFLGVGLIQGTTVRWSLLAQGSTLPAYAPIFWHLTGAAAAWLAFPIVQVAVANAHGPIARWIAVHAAGTAAFSAIHLSAMFLLRSVFSASFGLVTPARPLVAQALWELQNDLIVYGSLAVLWTLLVVWQDRTAAALREAHLEAQLAEARLESLAQKLDPHFLYNALHTVSESMYEDLAGTETLLTNLGALLRETLAPARVSWTLGEERRHTERYLLLSRARFGDRLSVVWEIGAELEAIEVPRFAIQTLVENSIKHNRAKVAPLAIAIRARSAGGQVEVSVEDDGCGFASAQAQVHAHAQENTRGLGRLEEILRLLYGDRGALERSPAEHHGARVALRVPAEGVR